MQFHDSGDWRSPWEQVVSKRQKQQMKPPKALTRKGGTPQAADGECKFVLEDRVILRRSPVTYPVSEQQVSKKLVPVLSVVPEYKIQPVSEAAAQRQVEPKRRLITRERDQFQSELARFHPFYPVFVEEMPEVVSPKAERPVESRPPCGDLQQSPDVRGPSGVHGRAQGKQPKEPIEPAGECEESSDVELQYAGKKIPPLPQQDEICKHRPEKQNVVKNKAYAELRKAHREQVLEYKAFKQLAMSRPVPPEFNVRLEQMRQTQHEESADEQDLAREYEFHRTVNPEYVEPEAPERRRRKLKGFQEEVEYPDMLRPQAQNLRRVRPFVELEREQFYQRPAVEDQPVRQTSFSSYKARENARYSYWTRDPVYTENDFAQVRRGKGPVERPPHAAFEEIDGSMVSVRPDAEPRYRQTMGQLIESASSDVERDWRRK